MRFESIEAYKRPNNNTDKDYDADDTLFKGIIMKKRHPNFIILSEAYTVKALNINKMLLRLFVISAISLQVFIVS